MMAGAAPIPSIPSLPKIGQCALSAESGAIKTPNNAMEGIVWTTPRTREDDAPRRPPAQHEGGQRNADKQREKKWPRRRG